MVYNLLKEFSKFLNNNKVFKQKDIDRVVKDSYRKSLIEKLKNN